MLKTAKKTTKKAPVAEIAKKNDSFTLTVIKDIIDFHKIKDGCTLVLLLMEAGLLWSIVTNIMS
jgi:succinylglutamate desuccinylase